MDIPRNRASQILANIAFTVCSPSLMGLCWRVDVTESEFCEGVRRLSAAQFEVLVRMMVAEGLLQEQASEQDALSPQEVLRGKSR